MIPSLRTRPVPERRHVLDARSKVSVNDTPANIVAQCGTATLEEAFIAHPVEAGGAVPSRAGATNPPIPQAGFPSGTGDAVAAAAPGPQAAFTRLRRTISQMV